MASFEREKHYLNHGFCKYEIFQNNILFYCEMYLYNMTWIATSIICEYNEQIYAAVTAYLI